MAELIEQLGDQPMKQLNSYLLHRGWPDDETFKRAIVEFPIYTRENLKCRLILQELEKAFGHKEKVDLATLQIEHIMPQTLTKIAGENCWHKMLGSEAKSVHKRYLHTLGNLTLTGYNPKLSNRPFIEKISELKSSNLSINKEILDVKIWDEGQITKRANELGQRIIEIWSRPETHIPYVPIKVAREEVFKAGQERRSEYWKRLSQMLKESHSPFLPVRPSDGTCVEMFMPMSDVQLFVQYLRPKSQMVVQLRFFRERGKQIYRALQQDKHLLEQEAKSTLVWTGGAKPTIASVLDGVSIKDPLDWLEQHEWITPTLHSFHHIFFERLLGLHTAIKEKSESKQMLLDFWLGFHQYLYENGNLLPHTAAYSSNNNDFATGRSAFWYSAVVNPSGKRILVALMLGTGVSRPTWPQLMADKEKIQIEVGSPLDWNCPEDQKIWTIKLVRNDSPLDERERWRDWYSWLFDSLTRFDKAFRRRISQLQLDDEGTAD